MNNSYCMSDTIKNGIFNNKFFVNLLLVFSILSGLLSIINISFTYRHTISLVFDVCFMYTRLSHAFILNPFDNIVLLNFWYHCLKSCFNPYKDLTSLQTYFLWLWEMKPSDCSMYIHLLTCHLRISFLHPFDKS